MKKKTNQRSRIDATTPAEFYDEFYECSVD